MNLIEQLKKIKKEKRLGLMTHVVVGYPSLEYTIRLVKLMEKVGVDIVELQIPFSDPLVDGPTIMKACEESLKKGTKVKDAFVIAKKLSKKISIPLLFMAYFNTVFNYGTKQFCQDTKKAGVSGLIVPDVSIEEEDEEHFVAFCKKYDLANIRVVSPSSTNERLRKNSEVGTGFIYVTARQGITGARETLDSATVDFLKRVKKFFSIPLAVGFGISKRGHLKALKDHADIAIVGSAIIDTIQRSTPKTMGENVTTFIKELRIVH